MPFFFFDSTFLLILPALFFSIWAQWLVKSTFTKYSKKYSRRGLTADEVARDILDAYQIGERSVSGGVPVMRVRGKLTDHYDPRDHTLKLSDSVYGSQSIAAIGVAAHEAGHAIQHAKGYVPLHFRNAIVPAAQIGSSLAFPLFFIGMIIPAFQTLLWVGIYLFIGAVIFTLITLPVEFNASRRAVRILEQGGYLADDELAGARKVLRAAAMTYVAAAAMAIFQLLRMLLIAQRRR